MSEAKESESHKRRLDEETKRAEEPKAKRAKLVDQDRWGASGRHNFINVCPHDISFEVVVVPPDGLGIRKEMVTIKTHKEEYGVVRVKEEVQAINDTEVHPPTRGKEITGLLKPFPKGARILTSAICAKVLCDLLPEHAIYTPDNVNADGFIFEENKSGQRELVGSRRLVRYLPGRQAPETEASVERLKFLDSKAPEVPPRLYNFYKEETRLYAAEEGGMTVESYKDLDKLDFPHSIPLKPMRLLPDLDLYGDDKYLVQIAPAPEFNPSGALIMTLPHPGANLLFTSPSLAQSLAKSLSYLPKGSVGKIYTLDQSTAIRDNKGRVVGAKRLVLLN